MLKTKLEGILVSSQKSNNNNLFQNLWLKLTFDPTGKKKKRFRWKWDYLTNH